MFGPRDGSASFVSAATPLCLWLRSPALSRGFFGFRTVGLRRVFPHPGRCVGACINRRLVEIDMLRRRGGRSSIIMSERCRRGRRRIASWMIWPADAAGASIDKLRVAVPVRFGLCNDVSCQVLSGCSARLSEREQRGCPDGGHEACPPIRAARFHERIGMR